ncbi:DUF6988 family protein [Vibrio diabolicus]|uniref:DUF6988 family protein n=1 Tax=Vibrio diabolicus TaxID=50719 RepID=UPI00406930CF
MRNKLDRWTQSVKHLTHGLQTENNERNQIGLGLLFTSNEHCSAIFTLSSKNINASALALFRPQVEAFIRGTWLLKCASQEEINTILTPEHDKDDSRVTGFPSNKRILNALTALEEYSDGKLEHAVNQMWSLICDFTHGGGMQAAWHVGQHGIGSYYSRRQVNDLLGLTSNICLLNSLEMARACNSTCIEKKLIESHKRIFK